MYNFNGLCEPYVYPVYNFSEVDLPITLLN